MEWVYDQRNQQVENRVASQEERTDDSPGDNNIYVYPDYAASWNQRFDPIHGRSPGAPIFIALNTLRRELVDPC